MKTEKNNTWTDVFRYALSYILTAGIVTGVFVVNGILMTRWIDNGNRELAVLCLVHGFASLFFRWPWIVNETKH